jgi:hypothetical protein
MRRLLPALLLAVQVAAWPAPATRAQADPLAELLAALQTALSRAELAPFAAAHAPLLPADQLAWLADVTGSQPIESVIMRERSRSATSLVADVFVSYGLRGFVATWMLDTGPGTSGNVTLRSISEISRMNGLVKLRLDETRQFAVTDLRITGPDFEARMPAGTAFVADVPDGTTALVLRGRTEVRFAPPDQAEQGQLRIYSGGPVLETLADDLFVRVKPSELRDRVTWTGFQAVPVDTDALGRARTVFAERLGLSYHFDLGDLTPDRWSLEPSDHNMLVDFRSGRFGWLTYARSPEDAEDVALVDRGRRLQISLYPSLDRRNGRIADPGDDGPYEVLHTALDLMFDPSRQWLSGRASVRLSMRRAATSLVFKLADSLVVSSVSSPQLGPLLPLRTSGYDSFVIGLPAQLPADQPITIDVQYHGRLESQELHQEGMSVEAAPQDPPFEEAMPMIIEPRFLYSQRSWWYPQPSVVRHAPASIRMTVPADYQVMATGELMSTTLSDADRAVRAMGRALRTVEFRSNRPVRYLACLVSRFVPMGNTTARVPAVAGRAVTAEPVEVPISVYTAPNQSRRIRATPSRVASMVEFYARLAGEAPYSSLSIASLESRLPGGHSPAYFALVNQPHVASTLSWSADPVAFSSAPDFFLAHEVAHQWWGQAIGGTDYHELWISEGFAQYFAWMYTAATESAGTAASIMSRMRQTAQDLSDAGPIHLGIRLGHLQNDRRMLRGIVYNKSAVVLHMLRRLAGDDAFHAAIRRLYTSARFEAIGVDDVRDAFQAETPLPLDRFFQRWVRESNVPSVRFTWSLEGSDVVIRAEQTGDVFDLPYDATLHLTDGTREQMTLRITEQSQSFRVTPRAPARRVTFDDELTIVRVLR